MPNDAAAALGSHHGERGGTGVGAALGAAGNMDEMAGRRQMRRQLMREHACADQSRRACGLAGTGNNLPARIIRARDESFTLGHIGKRRSLRARDADEQKPAAGRKPHGTRAVLGGDTGERDQCVRMRVAECQGDPKRNRAVPQRMPADDFGRCSRR